MKKKCYIAFMAFAVAVMLTVTFLPHHHHNGMVCTEVEYCEHDGTYNDEHTGHSDDQHSKCLDKSDFITAKRTVSLDDAGLHLLPLFIVAEQYFLFIDKYHNNTHKRHFYRQPIYKSADVCPTNILRGPPSLSV